MTAQNPNGSEYRRSLFEIKDDIRQRELELESLLAQIEDPEEEDAVIQQWLADLDELGEEAVTKINGYGWTISHAQAKADELNQDAKRLQAESKRLTRIAEKLSRNLYNFLHERAEHLPKQKNGLPYIETQHFRPRLVYNGGKLPLYIEPEIDLEALPSEFVVPQVVLNRDAVYQALNALPGDVMEGDVKQLRLEDGTPWAELQPRTTRISL